MRRTFVLLMTLAFTVLTGVLAGAGTKAPPAEPKLTDVRAQTQEFLRYQQTIVLTPKQEAVKREALAALPAPCCSDKSLYTCCCPCNLAKTAWGLANYLVARKGYGVEETRAKVSEWVRFINPAGYSGGNACYTGGGCAKPFAKAGCGGMSEPVTF